MTLKPCPFCGSAAQMRPHSHLPEHGDVDGVMGLWAVICNNPDAECNARILYCNSKEEAVQQWNTRVEPSEEESDG